MSQPNHELHRYPAGVPCWVDTEQPDPGSAARFYAALFGWEFHDAVPADAPGSYLIATLSGQDVAAIAPGEEIPSWITYIACDDLESTAAAVRRHGGEVVTGVRDLGPAGAWAGCVDPQGATFRLWRAGRRLGSQYVNAPGGWNFSNLVTPDPEGALAFYREVFGWEMSADLGAGMIRLPGYGDHLASTVDPDIHERQEFAPPGFADVVAGIDPRPDVAAHWSVAFTVESRDASAAAAHGAGGTVLSTADTEWTKDAEIADPQGARLIISQFDPPDFA